MTLNAGLHVLPLCPNMVRGRFMPLFMARGSLPILPDEPRATRHPLLRRGSSARIPPLLNFPRVVLHRAGPFCEVSHAELADDPLPRRGSAARALSPLNLPRVVPRRAGPFCEVRHAAR